MKYYKDPNDKVYAYESDGSQDAYIKPNLVPISEAEAMELANPPQPEPVPQQCSGRQGQKALLRTPYGEGSNMLSAVKELIASIPDDFMREDAELDFNAATWELGNPTLQALWAQLGGTEEQLYDLFRLAVTL